VSFLSEFRDTDGKLWRFIPSTREWYTYEEGAQGEFRSIKLPESELPAYSVGLFAATPEQQALLQCFLEMLNRVSKDGGKKREAGVKPPWWQDASHEAAIFSHLSKWMHGELVDKDSGAHPLAHLAWRALAIAYQETMGLRDPEEAK